jgi:hypothetical protein
MPPNPPRIGRKVRVGDHAFCAGIKHADAVEQLELESLRKIQVDLPAREYG